MAIRLQDFINVHITRDTVISTGRNKTVAYISSNVRPDDNKGDSLVYTSITEILNAGEVGNPTNKLYPTTSDVYKACEVFFNNGGKSILLVRAEVNLLDASTSLGIYRDVIDNLPLEVVAFSVQRGTITTVGENTTYDGGLLESDRAGLIAHLDNIEVSEGTAFRKMIALDVILLADIAVFGESVNAVYKYTTSYNYSCMAILSHLSKIDLNNPASISDYCFTEEATLTPVTNSTGLNWSVVGQNANVVLDIFKGVPTNFGGNTGGGTDIVEEYMTIFISQDVLLAEIELLKTKLKAENAVTRVHSALIRVLEVYYNVGFLVQSVYTGEDIAVNKNGINYTIISKGNMMTGGYVIVILPVTSRNTAEIASKSLPDVHLVFNTSKGIRYINNIGKII
jgi:hypothetical protein